MTKKVEEKDVKKEKKVKVTRLTIAAKSLIFKEKL